MPLPVSRNQSPDGSFPASRHRISSALLVPLSSPREANGAAAPAIVLSAATESVAPLTPAGSAAGPTMTKSLYITGLRWVEKPQAPNASSAEIGRASFRERVCQDG